MTIEGQILGTPAYMSPEQAIGEGHGVDRRSDIYSLGGILFELITGEIPFRGNTRMIIHQVVNDEPPRPRKLNSTVSRDLETICLKCLEKEPGKRYATAAEFADDLQRFLRGEPIHARPLTFPIRFGRWCKRNPGLTGLGLTVIASLLVGTGFSTYFAIQADTRLNQSRENERIAIAATTQASMDAADARASAIEAQFDRDAAKAAGHKAERLREIARQQVDEAAPQTYLRDMRMVQLGWNVLTPPQRNLLLARNHPRSQTSGLTTDLRGWEWYYLHSLFNTFQHSMKGHQSYVDLLQWSSSGRWVVSATSNNPDEDSTIRIWDAGSGKLYRKLTDYRSNVTSLTWQPDGHLIASGHANGEVIIWDVLSAKPRHTLKQGEASIGAVAWSPDSTRLALAQGKSIKLCDPVSGKIIETFDGHIRDIKRLQWNPRAGRLASSAWFGAVRIWEPGEEKPVEFVMQAAPWAPSWWSPAFAWSPDGNRLACETSRTVVTVIDYEPDKPSRTHLKGHTLGAANLQFSADGRFLAAFGPEHVNVWDTQGQRQPATSIPGTDGVWQGMENHLMIVPIDDPNSLHVVDMVSGTTINRLYGHGARVIALKSSPDGLRVATGSNDATVKLWNPDEFEPLQVPFSTRLYANALSVDAKRAAVYSWDRKAIDLVDCETGSLIRTLDLPDGLDVPVRSIAWCPDGKSLASCGFRYRPRPQQGRIIFWDSESGSVIHTLENNVFMTSSVFSPDGRRLAVRSLRAGGWKIDVIDGATGKRLRELDDHALGLSWSPDSKRIVTSTGNLWDTVTGKQVGELDLHCNEAISWSPSGKFIAGVQRDKAKAVSRLIVWDDEAKTLREARYPISSRINDLRWSPDESRLLVLTWNSVSVWATHSLDTPAVSFPDFQQSTDQSTSPRIYDARWSQDGTALFWTTATAIHRRDASRGYELRDQSMGGFSEISYKPAPSSGLFTMPNAFVRSWHFSPETKPCPQTKEFVPLEPEELDSLRDSAFGSPASTSPGAFVDFVPHFRGQKNHVSGYAARTIDSAVDQSLRLLVGSTSNDAIRVWLNGELVLAARELRVVRPDQNGCDIELQAGENVLLVELANANTLCGFYLRMEYPNGETFVLDDSVSKPGGGGGVF